MYIVVRDIIKKTKIYVRCDIETNYFDTSLVWEHLAREVVAAAVAASTHFVG